MTSDNPVVSHARAYARRYGRLPSGPRPPHDEPPGGGGMEDRVRALEVGAGKVEVRLDSIDRRLDGIDATLRRIEEKALNRWDVAIVTGGVIAALAAAAAWGPRLLALLPTP